MSFQPLLSCSGTFRRSEDQDETPNDQVIEERLIYSLSREYIEILG